MRLRIPRLAIVVAIAAACGGDPGPTTPPPPPPPPPPAVLLREIVIPNLPSPYYHFDYDTDGRVKGASFASGLRIYDVIYDGSRIAEMRNAVNRDTLKYVYDDAGHVALIKYVNSSGVIYTTVFFSYEGSRLTGIERDRRVDGGYIIDKTTSLSYYPDGNLRQVTEHRPAIDGEQTETTTVDEFAQYDDKVNVDGFSIIHDDFSDHLLLLPGVQLQKGNPAKETRTGDGLTFSVDYTYVYDDKNRPLSKAGEVTITSGTDTGRKVQISSAFTYY